MSIFDKFKHKSKDEASKEEAKVDIDSKEVKTEEKAPVENKNEEKVADSKLEVKKEVNKEAKPKVASKSNEVYGILVRPLITEKATNMSKFNQYSFEVSIKANKIQIASAIEARYGVKPKKVNIVNSLGRKVRYGRNLGKTKGWKKAIIILPKGKTIKIHEGV